MRRFSRALAALGCLASLAAVAADVNCFALPNPSVQYPGLNGIAVGRDGNLWFVEAFANRIGRMTMGGAITEFELPAADSLPDSIAAGPDGNLWFTERAGRIGRITASGEIAEFPLPVAGSSPRGIAAGRDGNLWFAETYGGRIGRITPGGVISEFAIPLRLGWSAQPAQIAAGPDGNLWFTENFEFGPPAIGRITPAGALTEFPVDQLDSVWGIAAGRSAVLTFAGRGGIGQISKEGKLQTFPFPEGVRGAGFAILQALDGSPWFTKQAGSVTSIGHLERNGAMTEVGAGASFGLVAGPDGYLWFTEADRICRLDERVGKK